jgi:hypothetical protein
LEFLRRNIAPTARFTENISGHTVPNLSNLLMDRFLQPENSIFTGLSTGFSHLLWIGIDILYVVVCKGLPTRYAQGKTFLQQMMNQADSDNSLTKSTQDSKIKAYTQPSNIGRKSP